MREFACIIVLLGSVFCFFRATLNLHRNATASVHTSAACATATGFISADSANAQPAASNSKSTTPRAAANPAPTPPWTARAVEAVFAIAANAMFVVTKRRLRVLYFKSVFVVKYSFFSGFMGIGANATTSLVTGTRAKYAVGTAPANAVRATAQRLGPDRLATATM